MKSIAKKYFLQYAGLSKGAWRGAFISLVQSSFGGICFFLSLYFVNTLGFSIAVAGTIMSCYGLGTITGGIISGKLSDKIDPFSILAVSVLSQGMFFLCLIDCNGILSLVIVMFFMGVSTYGVITTNNILTLSELTDDRARLRSTNFLYTASNLGIGLSALMVSIFSGYSFKNLFFSAGISLIVMGIYFLIFYGPPHIEKNSNKLSDNIDYAEKNENLKNNKKITRLVLICLFFVGFIIAQRSTTYTVFLHQAFPALGIGGVGFLYALNPISIIIFQTPLGNMVAHFNKVLIIGVGGFLMGLGMFILGVLPFFSAAILACFVYTFGEMLFFTMAQLVCYQKSAIQKRGYSVGLFRMVYAFSIVFRPSIFGFIYEHIDGDSLWYLCGFIGMATLLACNYYKKYF